MNFKIYLRRQDPSFLTLHSVSSIFVIWAILVSLIFLNAFQAWADGIEERATTSPANLSEATIREEGEPAQRVNLSFLTIFYGPSLLNPSRSQPGLSGDPDPNLPVNFRNFLNLGYNLTDKIALTGTFCWALQPYLDQKMQIQDPFLRLSDVSLIREGPFNLYADVRLHFGASTASKQQDQYFGVQTVEVASYEVPDTRFTIGTYAAARTNFFGKHGYGYDLDLYLGPNINYQISPTLLATLLYEMRGSHIYGTKFGGLNNDGTDLQPGLTWDVTPQIILNPYLNLLTGAKVSLSTTSFGLLANWNLM